MALPLARSLAVLVLAAIGSAQGVVIVDRPSGASPNLPWEALRPMYDQATCALTNAWGFPNCCGSPPGCLNPGNYVNLATLEVGYLDGDEHLDYLVVMSERLVLAMGVDDHDADGKPTATAKLYVIWAWFDPDATFYKHGYSTDKGAIADFDGDGDQEVAVVIGAPKNYTQAADGVDYDQVVLSQHAPTIDPNNPKSQKRVMIFGVDDTPTLDPYFGDVPLPKVLGWRWLNQNSCDVGLSTNVEPNPDGNGGEGLRVLGAEISGGPGMDLLVHTSEDGRAKVFAWDGTLTGFTPWLCNGYAGAATHDIEAFDLDGDGFDEILNNGVHDVHRSKSWTYASAFPAQFQQCGTGGNHADDLAPIDVDDDGTFESLYAGNHNCFDLLVAIDPSDPGAIPTQIYVNDDDSRICELWNSSTMTYEPYDEGQSLVVAKLLPGPDDAGYTGPHVLLTPKEFGGLWGSGNVSSIVTRPVPNVLGALDEVTYNHDVASGPSFNGPTQFAPPNLDWDGDRSADEIHSRLGNAHSTFRLVAGAYGFDHCSDPQPAVPYPFVWDEIAHHVPNSSYNYRTVDAFGDYRDEVVIARSTGLTFLHDPAALSNPYAHLPPLTKNAQGEFVETSYVRRLSGYPSRPLDYQDLHEFERLEVTPFTRKLAIGVQVQYQAIAHYVDASGDDFAVDLTDVVTWESGDPAVASFTGSVLTGHQLGYAVVRASLPGTTIYNEGPVIAAVSNATQPTILYAGWDDTYAVAGSPSTARAIARVLPPVKTVRLSGYGLMKDDGTGGDRVAGDRIYTWQGSTSVFGSTPSDQYPTIFATNQIYLIAGLPLTLQGALWPFLTVGSPPSQPVAVPGFPAMPWDSEFDGFGPRLAAVGYGLTDLTPDTPGLTTFFATPSHDLVDGILVYGASTLLATGINDDGNGADQFADDRLWTGSMTVTLPEGNYTTDLLPFQISPLNVGDAYPRLRIHQ